RDLGAQLELARNVVDQELVVAEAHRSPAPAADRRAEEVVEVGTVPREPAMPAEIAPVSLEVHALVLRELALRREGGIESDVGEPERVVDVRVDAGARVLLVALQHRIGALESQL